jgi:hypothetical protein
MYGGSAGADLAASWLAPSGTSSGGTCIGGIVVHGGRLSSADQAGSSAGAFDTLADLWSFALDTAACDACTGPGQQPPVPCSCSCSGDAPSNAGAAVWVNPAVSGFQWSRAYHAISWVPQAGALTAFGGYASVDDTAAGNSLGLVYSDLLLLQAPGLTPSSRALAGSAETPQPWKRLPDAASPTHPAVRFSHVGCVAGADGDSFFAHGGRFRTVYRDAWRVGVTAALAAAVPVTESDFGGTVLDSSGLFTVQILVAVLACSAVLLCTFAWCVRRAGARVGAGTMAVGRGGTLGAGAVGGPGGLQTREAPRGLTTSQIARLHQYKWPLLRHGADSAVAGTEAPSSDNTQAQCPICLEDFARGDSLRMLPCHHIAHPTCIDPWLARSIQCPLCKSDVLAALSSPSA